ncbi:MAG: hypothetical protein Q8M09_14935 [Pseudomonadota bacterium]|nr:hypothetical protein [Pseudomonadota bacterium]MDP1905519.1 hypothetical protein [Pseudomonadota bacterium]
MELLQLDVIKSGDGFCVAAYDEALHRFVRLSKERYRQFDQASAAIFSGSWTLLG